MPSCKKCAKKSVLEYRRHRDLYVKVVPEPRAVVLPSLLKSRRIPFGEKAVLKRKKIGAERCECVFDAHTSKASKELKVVLLHLWRVNVKTTGGCIYILLEDFHKDKTAPGIVQPFELGGETRLIPSAVKKQVTGH